MNAIDKYTEAIVSHIKDRPVIEVSEIRAMVSVSIQFAVNESLHNSIATLKEERELMVGKLNTSPNPHLVHERISVINEKIAHRQRQLSKVRNDEEYNQLKDYMKANGYNNVLQSFFDTLTI